MYKVTDTGVLKTVESWSIVVPLHDNDGNPFDKAVVDNVLQEILLNYPGFSVTNTLGYWKGSDQVFVDRNYQVLIDSVPDNATDSLKFFANLKKELQIRLTQEKVYVTKQDSKQELLSFDEFFTEVGVQVQSADVKNEAYRVAKRMAHSIDFVLQRLGYETSILRRDKARKMIVWERKICGVKLRSEFDDTLPAGVRVVAADQFAEVGAALAGQESFAIVGGYEFLLYILDRSNHRCLVDASDIEVGRYHSPYCLSPTGEPLDVKSFVEEFTMSIFTNCVILREEGFLPEEVKVSVGADGSLQWTSQPESFLLHSPASIPEKEIQLRVINCLSTALDLYETNAADPIAILQAKAKNAYFLKRAIVRHVLKSIRESKDPA